MKNWRTLLVIPALFLLLAAAAAPLAWRSGMKAAQEGMETSLSALGFTQARIGAAAYKESRTVYTDIRLDSDGFSTIRAVQAEADPAALLLRHPLAAITIDGIKMTGDFTKEEGLTISGWKPPAPQTPLPLPPWKNILLTGAQLDLDTPGGALRFQAKGQATATPENNIKIQGLFWAIQNQIKFSAEAEGTLTPAGGWSWNVSLHDGGMNFRSLKTSRMSGWLTAARSAPAAMLELSGQIDAGRIEFGDLSFSNVNLTAQGTPGSGSLIARGDIYGFENMPASLDIAAAGKEPQIKAGIETASLDDLMSFLEKLRSSDTGTGAFTSLLLTPGNLKRLRGEIRPLKYDRLELQLYGTPYDLAGKIIVKTFAKDGEQRQIVSLDPGNG